MRQLFRRTVCAVLVLAGLPSGLAGARAAPPERRALPSDAEVRKILADHVGSTGEGFGIVVGLVGPEGRRVVAYGRPGPGRRLGGDTAFEIGSVTKAFTALLLADMVERGEVALSDPVAKHLPSGIRLPERGGRSITLLDLATHTSGLPFVPDEMPAAGGQAGAETAAWLYRFLARYELPREIGAEREYSNLGYWLLGEALAARAGLPYASLLEKRILRPLRLRSTVFTVPPRLLAKLAAGHDAALQPAPSISSLPLYAAMPAAGGLLSTAEDLSKLLEVALGYERSPLAPVIAAQIRTRRPTSRPGIEQALGWMVEGVGDDPLVFHDGGTLGYASAVAWDPGKRVGVVVLSNQVAGVADLARHLLRPDIPLEARPAFSKPQEIALAPAVLDGYAGSYEAPEEGVFVITREGDFLTIQPPASWGLPKLRLRAESPRDFFVSELPLRVTFQTEGDGRVTGIQIQPPRGQQPIPANRIAAPSPP